MKKMMRQLALALALAAGLGAAQAAPTVIDFDGGLDTSLAPYADFGLLTHNDALIQGGYFVATASTKTTPTPQDDDMVGALVNGADIASTCATVACPSNNGTQFLAMVNDGLPWLGRLDGDVFQIKSVDASILSADGATVVDIPMILRVYGFFEDGSYTYEDLYPSLFSGGDLAFETFDFSAAFADLWFAEVDFVAYACDASGSCNRSNNLAQFALDNIVLNDASTAVPEPASLALVMLALAGAGTVRRRRGQAA